MTLFSKQKDTLVELVQRYQLKSWGNGENSALLVQVWQITGARIKEFFKPVTALFGGGGPGWIWWWWYYKFYKEVYSIL